MSFPRFIENEWRAFHNLSRKLHLVSIAVVLGPAVLICSFILFPILEERNLGYTVFHFACHFCFVLAGVGLAAWTIEKRYQGKWTSWALLLMLVAAAVGAFTFRIFGDFYWAFNRGYFLD